METIDNLVFSARNGDVASQKNLLDKCQRESLPLTYQNLKKASALGMNFDDLRELIIPSFVKALNNYNPTRAKFINYFKYLYLMQIKTEFRSRCSKKKRELKLEYCANIDKEYSKQITSEHYSNDKEKYHDIDKEMLYEILVNDCQVGLTPKEYTLIKMYFEDIEIKEMSRILNRNYTETFRSLKRAINKIKTYFGEANS